jgi:hypothetical protein
MHEDADAVAVFLNDGDVKFGLPDDTAEKSHPKAGTAQWTPAGKHLATQASLTGESLPVEKFDTAAEGGDGNALEFRNLCFLGTAVESGMATGLVAETGSGAYLGTIASTLTGEPPETSFDRGISHLTWLMIRFIAVMVPLVFVINGLTKNDWKEAFFFAFAVAVGLTTEMLPMIVSACLSRGALLMSRKKVIHSEVKVSDGRKVDELPSEQARKPAVRPFPFSGAAPSARTES